MRSKFAAVVAALLLGPQVGQADVVRAPEPPSWLDWRMEKPLALYLVKHAELARQKAVELGATSALKRSGAAKALVQSIETGLSANVLEPLFRRFPDLRGQDVRPLKTAPVDALGPIDQATAERIEKSVQPLEAEMRALTDILNKAERNSDDVQIELDLSVEIGFITAPVDRQYHAMAEAHMARLKAPPDPRTQKGDASMRQQAVPLRDVRLTPAARTAISEFARVMAQHGAYVLAISWDLGSASKGPDDTQWKKMAPGLSIGGYERTQLPPDIVATLDGIPIVFLDSKPPRIRGKTIDFKGRHFVLQD